MELTLMEKGRAAVHRVWNEQVLGEKSDIGTESTVVNSSQALVDGEQSAGTTANVHTVVSGVHGLHNILQYDQYDEETGLFYSNGSISFAFEVLPQTGANDEMANRLLTLFTPIPPGYGIQWTLLGAPNLGDQLEAYVDARHIAVDRGLTTPFFTELARRRVEHVRKGLGKPMFANDNFMVKNIRLMFSITTDGKSTDRRLVADLQELRETLRAALKTSNLPSVDVDALGLKRFLWPVLNPASMFTGGAPADLAYDDSRSLKEQMTEFGQQVRVRSSEVLFGQPPDTEEEEDRIAVRSFGVLQYPQKKELWQMSNIIGSFFDDGLQYPCPFVITGGVFTLEPTAAQNRAQIKAGRAKMNAASKMAAYQPELAAQNQDWSAVMQHMSNGGKLVELYHTLVLIAPKPVMNRCSQVAVNIWKNEGFTIAPLRTLHLAAFYASLPMTLTKRLRNDLMKMRLLGTKTSINAVDMSPVIGEWRGAGDPVMMFFGRRGSPAFVDFYSNQQGNYNVFIAGVSGSGKSVAMSEVVSAYRGVGGRAWVIDVGRSYQNLVRLQNGMFIEFNTDSKMCINPFTWVGQDSEIDFKSELRMLKPMVGRMASPNENLSGYQYAVIEKAIVSSWEKYGPDTNPTRIQEYLLTESKDQNGQPDRIAFELGMQLQPFTEKGIYGSFFNGRANLSLDHDMVGLELEELKNAPDLRRVVLFVLTSRIASDMYRSRDRKKLCLVDEAWQLLGADKETAEFIEEGYRRARKYNGIFCVGTQGIEDAYKNDASKAAYNNADWKIFLRQDKKNLEKLIEDGTVSFDAAVKKQLLSLRTEKGRFSEMLIQSPNGDAVVRHIPDPFSLLMSSTNAADYTELEGLLKNGLSTLDAMQVMMGRRGHDRRMLDRRRRDA